MNVLHVFFYIPYQKNILKKILNVIFDILLYQEFELKQISVKDILI